MPQRTKEMKVLPGPLLCSSQGHHVYCAFLRLLYSSGQLRHKGTVMRSSRAVFKEMKRRCYETVMGQGSSLDI